jgi:hypothetical protein
MHMLSGAAQKPAVQGMAASALLPTCARTASCQAKLRAMPSARPTSALRQVQSMRSISNYFCRSTAASNFARRLCRAAAVLAPPSGSRYLSQSYPPGVGYAAELSSPSCSSRRRGSSGQRSPTPSSADAPCATRRLRSASGCARRRGPLTALCRSHRLRGRSQSARTCK